MIFRGLKYAVILVMINLPLYLHSQLFLTSYLETGKNAVYNQSYFSFAILPSCEYRDVMLKSGFAWTYAGQKENRFEGYYLKATKHIYSIKRHSFDLTGLYLWKPFSSELREINWGLMINYTYRHFQFLLGNNHRTYRYSNKSRNLYELSRETSRITEPWNLIYELQYTINESEKPWNLVFSLSNIDYFLINQETNPVYHLKADYFIADNIDLFLEIWYKSAGMFNMKVNHFGYSFRLGAQWKIADL